MEADTTFYPRLRYYYRGLIPLFEKPKVAAYTMLVLSLFTVSIFGAFAIRPTLATIAQLTKRIEDQKLVNIRMDDKIAQLRVAQIEYQNIRPDLDAIFGALPDTPQASALLGKLNRTLIENNIDIVILQINSVILTKPQQPSPSSTIIAFTLNGKASYQDILLFVDLLTRTDRILTIDSVDIGALPQVQGGSFTQGELLNITIRGKSYVLWDQEIGQAEERSEGG